MTKWLLGATFTVALTLSGWIATAVSTRVTTLETINASRGERIATLEEQTRTLREQLTRIELKLDKALAK